VTANWFPAIQRGRAIGLIGTGYQLGGALTFFIAGWAAERFGWRGALYLPAVLLVITSVHMLLFLRESPVKNEINNPSARNQRIASKPATGRFRDNIQLTLSNPGLWLVAVSLLLLDACRYGFTDWGVMQLKEVVGDSVSLAAFKNAVLPLGGMAGAFLSGWATDRFFSSRRAPMIFFLLLTLGLLAIAYNFAIHAGMALSVAVLFLVGFCIFGAQVLLVGTFPVDLARRGTAAAAVGFVNFMGYMGAAAGDKLTGHLAEEMGWKFAVLFWAGCAFLAAGTIACLWKASTVVDRALGS
jgi:sugar phosphate permease